MPLTDNFNTIPEWEHLWNATGYRDPEQPPVIERKKAVANMIPAGASLLDVAAGASQIIQYLQRDIYYVALDFSLTALHFQKHPSICADIRDLPIKPLSFDYVVAMEILEHLDRPDLFIPELCRIARKAVIFSVPDNRLTPQDTKWHLRCYTDHSLTLLIKSASGRRDITIHKTELNLIAEVHK